MLKENGYKEVIQAPSKEALAIYQAVELVCRQYDFTDEEFVSVQGTMRASEDPNNAVKAALTIAEKKGLNIPEFEQAMQEQIDYQPEEEE